MPRKADFENLADRICRMDRDELITRFETFRAPFPLDFTREFLHAQTEDRLRHLLMAICLQTGQTPTLAA